MKSGIVSNFIPILRSDCEYSRISSNRFKVVVNDREEFIDLDKKSGDLLNDIFPLINGKRSVTEISKCVTRKSKKRFSTGDVKEVVTRLFRWGLLSGWGDAEQVRKRAKDDFGLLQIRYLSSLTSYPREMRKKLENACIAIVGAEYISSLILRSLYLCGVKSVKLVGSHALKTEEIPFFALPNLQKGIDWYKALSEEAAFCGFSVNIETIPDINRHLLSKLKDVDILLLLLPGIKPELALKINKTCLNTNTKLLFGTLGRTSAVIGPVVIPFQSACLTCRNLRYKENYTYTDRTQIGNHEGSSYYGELQRKPMVLNSFLAAYAHMLSGYACMHLLQISNLLVNREVHINFDNANTTTHFILRLPRCPACGVQTRHPKHKIFQG